MAEIDRREKSANLYFALKWLGREDAYACPMARIGMVTPAEASDEASI